MPSATEKSILFDNFKIVYDSYGSGNEALVFIHGGYCNRKLWSAQSPLFEKYRSLLIDMPGHGESDAPDIDYTPESLARSVESILKEEQVTKAVLVAHSLGGPVSTMILRLFPDLVEGLIYVDSFFNAPQAYLPLPVRQQIAEQHADNVGAKQFPQDWQWWTNKTSDDVRIRVVDSILNTPSYVRSNSVINFANVHAWRYTEVYDIPALLLARPVAMAIFDQFWLHHMPKLEVNTDAWMENGHFLFMEDPETFNQKVEEFLRRHGLMRGETTDPVPPP